MGLLYTKLKMFHFKDKLDSLPEFNSNILSPVHIRLKPINACNQSCNYCAYRKEGMQLGKDMDVRSCISKEKMREIVADLIDMDVKAVTFSGGGEPFIYPYFIETLKSLESSNIKLASLTNGSLLFGEVAEIFASRGSWLRVSLDGWDDKSYSQYRNVGDGSFSKLISNMKAFKKLNGECLLGVSVILDENNYLHIYDLISKLKDCGVDSVKISPCIVSNESEENNNYHDQFFYEAHAIISDAVNKLSDDSFEVYNCYHKMEIDFSKDYNWCPFIQMLTVIGADLNVYSCQDKAYNLDSGLLGSIKDVSFKEFWFANKNKFFSIKPCNDCSHHCVANEKNKLILEYLDVDFEHMAFV